ncbi:MAG: bifunctional diaminohydroxyphosphoribosylaminopyrimidine deaminase/5-amino-6-(5-phosphoribosylamino)uracil reductase RibD [Syntrophales bacterium]|nr:bifunctional diaminohydroxyphosphoribosylaminopyrimidine deaminase/5-amino-6-(5-phosphoribosylamino)uracil reductase RibD [Syntrophales bacterium]
MTDKFYMRRALRLARRGEKWVSPNPMVGAVIVKEDRIIGEGYHERFGGNHAEINAIRNASEAIEDATLYVTLEPCNHYGRTPPCVETLIACKPVRVVIGTSDPNPLVTGKGIEALKNHGIETTLGILEKECKQLNERFFKFIKTRIPFVTLKFAQSLDGRIAGSTGDSRWISSTASLRFAHTLRSIHDGILVGIGTVLQDDPDLTVRLVRGRNPVRIVVDSHLRIPLKARVLKNQEIAKTIIATTCQASFKKRARLEEMGIEILPVAQDNDCRINLKKLLTELGKRNVSSILVEGGAEIITSTLKEELADRVIIVIAPKIIGKGIEAVGDLGSKITADAFRLSYKKVSRKGDDIIIELQVVSHKS